MSVKIWSSGFWLPPGLQWENFKEDRLVNKSIIGTNKYARPMDLLYPIPMALLMIMARIVVEKVIFKQLGQALCVPSCRQPRPEMTDAHLKRGVHSYHIICKGVMKFESK